MQNIYKFSISPILSKNIPIDTYKQILGNKNELTKLSLSKFNYYKDNSVIKDKSIIIRDLIFYNELQFFEIYNISKIRTLNASLLYLTRILK